MANPKITLAGKEYEVPSLVPRQQRHVLPALLRAVPAMGKFASDAKAGQIFEAPFPTAAYDDMLEIIYWGAIWPVDKKRGTITIEDLDAVFDEMPLSFAEMTQAVLTIQYQTGLFSKASGDAQPGEATAAPPSDSLKA